ncbi:MAG: branched-chain amino acid ABC transporter permease [Actinobacteria bacterium]|nr:branched-chain amino acid ABC transporter permease [Actinomycetota bacterium]
MTSGLGARGMLLLAAAAVYVVVPLRVSDFGLTVLVLAGIAAIGALGLNLLTGYTGQISLGHAAFLGVGAYVCAGLGGSLGLPFPVWLAAAMLAGGLTGLLVSPFAVRFRGHTLAVVTLALVFVGQHGFRAWRPLTGGNAGRGDLPSPAMVEAWSLSREQGWFFLVWGLVAVVAALTANLVRSRIGRAMIAVREGEQAASVLGVNVAATKMTAFVLCGALAALAGALYGSYKQYVGPDEWSLLLSVQFLAMVLIGGAGTVSGPILGALLVTALPRVVEEVSGVVPLLAEGTDRGLTAAGLSQLLFGVLIVVVVVAEPRGLSWLGARLWARLPARRATRPV